MTSLSATGFGSPLLDNSQIHTYPQPSVPVVDKTLDTKTITAPGESITEKLKAKYGNLHFNKTKKCFFVGLMILGVAAALKPTLDTYVLPVSAQKAAQCIEMVLNAETHYELTDSQTQKAENCIHMVNRYTEKQEKLSEFPELNSKIRTMRAKYFPEAIQTVSNSNLAKPLMR